MRQNPHQYRRVAGESKKWLPETASPKRERIAVEAPTQKTQDKAAAPLKTAASAEPPTRTAEDEDKPDQERPGYRSPPERTEAIHTKSPHGTVPQRAISQHLASAVKRKDSPEHYVT